MDTPIADPDADTFPLVDTYTFTNTYTFTITVAAAESRAHADSVAQHLARTIRSTLAPFIADKLPVAIAFAGGHTITTHIRTDCDADLALVDDHS